MFHRRARPCLWHLPTDCWRYIARRLHYDDLQSLWMTGSHDLHHVLQHGQVVLELCVIVNVPLADHAYHYRWPVSMHRWTHMKSLHLKEFGYYQTKQIYWIPSLTIPLTRYMPKTLTQLCLHNMMALLEHILMVPPLEFDRGDMRDAFENTLTQSRAFLNMPRNAHGYASTAVDIIARMCHVARACSPWISALPNLLEFEYSNGVDEENIYGDPLNIWTLGMLPATLQVMKLPNTNIAMYHTPLVPTFETWFPNVRSSQHLHFLCVSQTRMENLINKMRIHRTIYDDTMRECVILQPSPRLAHAQNIRDQFLNIRECIKRNKDAILALTSSMVDNNAPPPRERKSRHILACTKCDKPLVCPSYYFNVSSTVPPLQVGHLDTTQVENKAPAFTRRNMASAVAHLNDELIKIVHMQATCKNRSILEYRSIRVRDVLYLAIQLLHSAQPSWFHAVHENASQNAMLETMGEILLSGMYAACGAAENDDYDDDGDDDADDDNNDAQNADDMASLTMSSMDCDRHMTHRLKGYFSVSVLDSLKYGICPTYQTILWSNVFIILQRYMSVQMFAGDAQYESSQCHVNCDMMWCEPISGWAFSTVWQDVQTAALCAVNAVIPSKDTRHASETNLCESHITRDSMHGGNPRNTVSEFGDEYRTVTIALCDRNTRVAPVLHPPPSLAALHIDFGSHKTSSHAIMLRREFVDLTTPLYQLTCLDVRGCTKSPNGAQSNHVLQHLSHLPRTLTKLSVRDMSPIPQELIFWPPNLTKLVLQNQNVSRKRCTSMMTREQLQCLPHTLMILSTNQIDIHMLDALPPSLTKLVLSCNVVITEAELVHLHHLPQKLTHFKLRAESSISLWGRVNWPASLITLSVHVDQYFSQPVDFVWHCTDQLDPTVSKSFSMFPRNLRALVLEIFPRDVTICTLYADFVHALPPLLQSLTIDATHVWLSAGACAALGHRFPHLRTLDVYVSLEMDKDLYTFNNTLDDAFLADIHPNAVSYAYIIAHYEFLAYANKIHRPTMDPKILDMYKRAYNTISTYMMHIIASLPRGLHRLRLTISSTAELLKDIYLPWHMQHLEAMPPHLIQLHSGNKNHPTVNADMQRQYLPHLQYD